MSIISVQFFIIVQGSCSKIVKGAVYKGRPANGEGGGFEISDISGRGEGGGL